MVSTAFSTPLVVCGAFPSARVQCRRLAKTTYRVARAVRSRMSADGGDAGGFHADGFHADGFHAEGFHADGLHADVGMPSETTVPDSMDTQATAPENGRADIAQSEAQDAHAPETGDFASLDLAPGTGSAYVPAVSPPAAVTEVEAEEDDPEDVQGPALAPTAPGVSDTNLAGKELALMQACYDGDMRAIETALDDGADVSAADVNRRMPLHFAAAHGLRTICVRLIEAGAPINAQDLLGYTPLHMATGYERVDTVSELIKQGADANICTFEDRLPVEIAEASLESTREQRVLGWVRNGETLEKRRRLVEILDHATEEHDDGEEEEENELVAAAKALSTDDGTTVVVRKRETSGVEGADGASKGSTPSIVENDVKVTIRFKGKTVER